MSPARVRVALTPPAPGTLPASACAVAVDVLRATTTLAFARANGVASIEPFASTAEALAARAARPGTLACGERDGRIVLGFDLGNSPAEYTRERVAGKTLAFASTNGSRALLAGSRCQRRLLASFANASATLDALAREPEIVIVCAGKLGSFAIEDGACAGTLAASLASRGARLVDDASRLAATLACSDAAEVHALVTGSDHARWLTSFGEAFAEDVRLCATLDTLDAATEW
jgi:2-phosphosulfolactate phosphatase